MKGNDKRRNFGTSGRKEEHDMQKYKLIQHAFLLFSKLCWTVETNMTVWCGSKCMWGIHLRLYCKWGRVKGCKER